MDNKIHDSYKKFVPTKEIVEATFTFQKPFLIEVDWKEEFDIEKELRKEIKEQQEVIDEQQEKINEQQEKINEQQEKINERQEEIKILESKIKTENEKEKNRSNSYRLKVARTLILEKSYEKLFVPTGYLTSHGDKFYVSKKNDAKKVYEIKFNEFNAISFEEKGKYIVPFGDKVFFIDERGNITPKDSRPFPCHQLILKEINERPVNCFKKISHDVLICFPNEIKRTNIQQPTNLQPINTLETIFKIKNSEIEMIIDVEVNQQGNILVTTNKGLIFLKDSKCLQPKSLYHGFGEIKSSKFIDGHIYIADYEDDKIHIFDLDLNPVSQYKIVRPTSIACRERKILVYHEKKISEYAHEKILSILNLD